MGTHSLWSRRFSAASLTVAGLALLAPSSAHAGWSKLSSGDSSVYLTGVCTPDGVRVFTAGNQLDQSGSLPSVHPHVYGSSDGGHTFTEISSALSQLGGFASTTAIAFIDPDHGWVAIGNKVYWTVNGGSSWTGVDAGASTNDLHAFDPMHVVRVGDNGSASVSSDGGQTWKGASVPSTEVAFQKMAWIDNQHGWASAQIADSNGIASEADVFITDDGGKTWTAGARIAGMEAGPLFFLPDGKTGWLATAQQQDTSSDQPDQYQATAHLLKTTDGGKTFQDISLPTNVGTLSLLGSQPINTAILYGMFWADAQRGHLVGAAYLGQSSSSSGGGGSSTSQSTTSWKLVDYLTTDGGQTWQKTNLGTIQGSLTSPPPSDGMFWDATFTDLYNGWLSANAATVWGYQLSCTSDSICGTGYHCVAGHCVLEQSSSTGSGSTGGSSGGSSAGSDSGTTAKHTVHVGCGCGVADAAGLPLLMLAVLALRRDRRARGATQLR